MAIDHGTIGALVLAILIAFLISSVFRTKVDSREPLAIYPRIPFVGHVIGMLREGPLYFVRINEKIDVPIFTLPMLGGRSYICNSPVVAAQIQRASTALDFDALLREMTPRMVGLSTETKRLLYKTNVIDDSHHAVAPKLQPKNMDDIIDVQLRHYETFINRLDQEQEVDLFKSLSNQIAAASMTTFYGPNNPFSVHPELIDSFWDWERGLVMFMLNVFPSITARRAYLGFHKCLKAFQDYIDQGLDQEACSLIKDRANAHYANGITKSEQARFEMALSFAFNTNAAITIFWLLNNVWSRPALLQQIRNELRENALTGPTTISFPRIRDACPLFNSVYRETLRIAAPMMSARWVVEDTILGGEYLLRKDSVIQIAGRLMHRDPSVWGPDVDEFNPHRFIHSPFGTKTSDDGGVPEESSKATQVHPAAFRAFGGGVSKCPGRHFAQMEILSLSALLLLGFDALPPKRQTEVKWDPKLDETQFPFSVTKPVRELRLKLRRNEAFKGTWKFE